MFGFIKKMFGATEKTAGAAVEEVAEVVEEIAQAPEKVVKTKKQLEALAKKQLEEYGRELGVELDRRLTKAKLIAQLLKEQKKGD
jgi:hypothetical protein